MRLVKASYQKFSQKVKLECSGSSIPRQQYTICYVCLWIQEHILFLSFKQIQQQRFMIRKLNQKLHNFIHGNLICVLMRTTNSGQRCHCLCPG